MNFGQVCTDCDVNVAAYNILAIVRNLCFQNDFFEEQMGTRLSRLNEPRLDNTLCALGT